MVVWSRHDYTQPGDETTDRRRDGRLKLLQRLQIEAWINEGGAGGEPLA